MDASNYALSALATIGVLGAAVLIALLRRWLAVSKSDVAFWRELAAVMLSAVITAVALFALTGAPGIFFPPVAGLAAVFAVLATSGIRSSGRRLLPLVIVAVATTALVFEPLVAIVFGSSFDPFGTGLGFIDLAGALPAIVGGGFVALAIAFVERGPRHPSLVARSSGMAVVLAIALLIAVLGWSVGIELAVDAVTPSIWQNTALMGLAGAATGSLVERLRHRQNTAAGSILGLVAGVCAALPASAYLTAELALVVGLLAGALCALLPRGGALALVATGLVASTLSIVLLGTLATNISFIYTGQPEVLFGQVLGIVVAAVLGLVVGGAAWAALRRWPCASAAR
jgi:ammonia channel protein AmtB